jgi:hypothetical protein
MDLRISFLFHLYIRPRGCHESVVFSAIGRMAGMSTNISNSSGYYRPYSKSSLTLTLNEWRFNLSLSRVSLLFLNSWRASVVPYNVTAHPPAIQKQPASIDTREKLRLNLHSLSVSELLEYGRMSGCLIQWFFLIFFRMRGSIIIGGRMNDGHLFSMSSTFEFTIIVNS